MDTELLFKKDKQSEDEYLIEKWLQDYEKILQYYYNTNKETSHHFSNEEIL